MPSWFETAATWGAVTYVGAIAVPIVHFYGAKEVGFILSQSQARVLITADRFGHVDMLANLEQLRPSLDALELVFVLGGTPGDAQPFSALAEHGPLGDHQAHGIRLRIIGQFFAHPEDGRGGQQAGHGSDAHGEYQ